METLFNSNGLAKTRVKRAFKWVITFRDFPAGSWQEVDGSKMMTHALTLFTKGRALFFQDGVQLPDRVPGILSSDYEPTGLSSTFKLEYVEPTTRLCIPAMLNDGVLPEVEKIELSPGQVHAAKAAERFLVCLGNAKVNGKIIEEERTFHLKQDSEITSDDHCILLKIL